MSKIDRRLGRGGGSKNRVLGRTPDIDVKHPPSLPSSSPSANIQSTPVCLKVSLNPCWFRGLLKVPISCGFIKGKKPKPPFYSTPLLPSFSSPSPSTLHPPLLPSPLSTLLLSFYLPHPSTPTLLLPSYLHAPLLLRSPPLPAFYTTPHLTFFNASFISALTHSNWM